MPKFSAKSRAHLAQAHPILQTLFNAVIEKTDCTVLDAQRGRAAQEKAFALGNSRAHFGQSAHNFVPAVALDVVPYPLDWADTKAFQALAKIVLETAREQGADITWGGTFTTIKDMPHYELGNWKSLVAAHKVRLVEP